MKKREQSGRDFIESKLIGVSTEKPEVKFN